MKHLLSNVFVWSVLVLLAYFATDIIDKGQVLNSLTPVPILGYLLWAAILLVLWFLFLWPIIEFCRLSGSRPQSLKARLERAWKQLEPYRAAENDSRRELFVRFHKARQQRLYLTEAGQSELCALLSEAAASVDCNKEARQLIKSYSIAAGIGVVFSRNAVLDGLVMLVMQARLVIALAKLRGYRPSPVFNLCCMVWVFTNSLVMALSQGAVEELALNGIDYMVEMIADTELVSSLDEAVSSVLKMVTFGAVDLKIPQGVKTLAFQGVLAGASVYVTGRIFLGQLDREGEPITMSYLVKLRREGYAEMASSVFRGVADKLLFRRSSVPGGEKTEPVTEVQA